MCMQNINKILINYVKIEFKISILKLKITKEV